MRKKAIENITKNSIVQIDENGGEYWMGCIVQVSGVNPWGVIGFVQIPMQGPSFVKLLWAQIEYIGEAFFTME